MPAILVTGGAGFIGSHLCERLLLDGHQVLCVDNLQTGSYGNIAALTANQHFRFIQWDIELPLNFVSSVDMIFNLACPASPFHYQADPVRTMRTNVLGAINVLEVARRTGARILQSSTSEVYGEPEIHPQSEDYRGCVTSFGPRACYDEGKRAAESLFFDYSRMYGVDIRIARIFNTYGPRMAENDGRVVSNFVLQALQGKSLTVFGDGSQTRSFCFATDMVSGLIALMNSGPHMAKPCNLGNPEEFTIGELAEMICAMVDREVEVEYRDLPQDDPTRRQPDISLARRELGWAPKVTLEQGLEHSIAYFDKLLHAKRQHAKAAGLLRAMEEPQFLQMNGASHPWPSVGTNGTDRPGTSRHVLKLV